MVIARLVITILRRMCHYYEQSVNYILLVYSLTAPTQSIQSGQYSKPGLRAGVRHVHEIIPITFPLCLYRIQDNAFKPLTKIF